MNEAKAWLSIREEMMPSGTPTIDDCPPLVKQFCAGGKNPEMCNECRKAV